MEQAKENKMGTAPVYKLILTMSVPAIFSMLIQSLYNIVDSIFVARVAPEALTAVSLAFPVQALMIAVGVGTGVGINSLISRRLGEKRLEDADHAASHGLILMLLSSLLFVLLGIFFTKPFFHLFTNNPVVFDMGCTYTYIVTIFSFGAYIQMFNEKMLQATGNMIYPMIFQLLGAVLNLIFDPILIFGYFGVPAMGVAGAAIATVGGQIVASIYSLYVVLKKEHQVKITLRGFQFHGRIVRDIYAVGFPSIVMQAINSFLTMGLNAILIGFSEVAVSVLGVYYKLQSFVFMPVFGLNQGVMPIMGYNFGARNRKRLTQAIKGGCLYAFIIMGIGTLLFMVFPAQLLALFNADEQMLRVGIVALRTISLCFIPAAFGIMFSTLFQATGNGGKSLFISLLRQVFLILPLAYFLAKLGLNFVWYSFPLAEAVSLVVSVVMFWRYYQTHIRTLTPLSGAKTDDEAQEEAPAQLPVS